MKFVCCPRCDHAGPPGKDFAAQGLVKCAACGLLFEPGRKTVLPEAEPDLPGGGKVPGDGKGREAPGGGHAAEEAGGDFLTLRVHRRGAGTLPGTLFFLPIAAYMVFWGLQAGARMLQPDRLASAKPLLHLLVFVYAGAAIYLGAKLLALQLRALAFWLLRWPSVVLAPHALLLPEWFEAELPWEEIAAAHYTNARGEYVILQVPRLTELRAEADEHGFLGGLIRGFFGRGSSQAVALDGRGLETHGANLEREILKRITHYRR